MKQLIKITTTLTVVFVCSFAQARVRQLQTVSVTLGQAQDTLFDPIDKKETSFFKSSTSFGTQNSPDIYKLQEILIKEDLFDEKPSGNFLPKTRLGLMKLQKKNNLDITGTLTLQTLDYLKSAHIEVTAEKKKQKEIDKNSSLEKPTESFFGKIKSFFE